MSSDNSPLGLYIPQQTIEFPDMPYLKPRDAEKWIANLPTAHIGETARLIYKAVASINRIPLPAQQRFKILELFREPFEYIGQALQKRYINQAFPLSDKNLKIAELAKELQFELAIGYKIIIEASFSKKSGRVNNKLLLTSIFRTLCCLGEGLLTSYLTYSPPQISQIWREINHLYLFSEHNQFTSKNIKDDVNPLHSERNIGDVYKHLVLLSLSNPYRLAQNEILRVNHALKTWAEHSSLHMFGNGDKPAGIFAIDLENNAAPSYYNISQKSIDTNYIRIFDTSVLTQLLQEKYEEESQEVQHDESGLKQQTNEINKETLHRLILAWGTTPKRSFSREGKTTEERIDITTSLASTHFHIQKQYELERQEQDLSEEENTKTQVSFLDKAAYESGSLQGLCEPGAQSDVWDNSTAYTGENHDNYHFPSIDKNSPFEDPKLTPSKTQTQEKDCEIHNCLLINKSAGGYCISWDNASRTKTVVGSLIGIKNKTDAEEDDWSIGIIRWLKSPEKTPMYVGIELLAPTAYAIASKRISGKEDNEEYTRALLLPELQSAKQSQTLITQFLHKVGDRLELDVHGQLINVKLTNILESSNAFNQFEFTIIKSEKKSMSDQADGIKNFDAVWSSL